MMQLLTHTKSSLVMAIAALSVFTNAANAAVLDIESGTNALLGIDGININGSLWNVDFMDGLWHEIDGDFATTNHPVTGDYATAFALTAAELDIGHAQIKAFLDPDPVSGINYGNSPVSINGCSSVRFCSVMTAYSVFIQIGQGPIYNGKSFVVSGANNINLGDPTSRAASSSSTLPSLTFGVWSPAQISAVPEPSSYAMLLAGLGLLGFAKRRQSL